MIDPTPEELLRRQYDLIDKVWRLQSHHQVQLENLQHDLRSFRDAPPVSMPAGFSPWAEAPDEVKVIDFNMPFLSLVGFLFKLYVASIIVGLFVTIPFLILLMLLTSLGLASLFQ